MISRTTVSPPTPESNTPMGASHLFFIIIYTSRKGIGFHCTPAPLKMQARQDKSLLSPGKFLDERGTVTEHGIKNSLFFLINGPSAGSLRDLLFQSFLFLLRNKDL